MSEEKMIDDIRTYLHGIPDFTEKKMFGGWSFLYKGKMTIGVLQDKYTVRVVPEKMDHYSALPETAPMAFTGKPMKEFLYVDANSITNMEELSQWIELGIEHAKWKLGEEG